MSKESFKLSVVIPVLNNLYFLERAITSVLHQDYQQIELIIIDGGSTDGSLEIIKKYSSQIYYWESGKDLGISDAFNRGLRKSTGDLIAILNSDDYWKKNTVDLVVSACIQHGNYGVYYGSIEFIDSSTMSKYIKSPIIKNMACRMSLFHPATFIKKEVYEKVGLYSLEYEYAMDCEWLHRSMNSGVSFYKINRVLACMSLGGKSDEFYVRSLWEYRKSSIENNIAPKIKSYYCFIKYAFLKYMTSYKFIRILKQKTIDKARSFN